MRRTIAATSALAAGLLLGACGGDTTPEAKPKATATKTASAAPTYDEYDCRALLERNYDDDNVHDSSGEPECESLTRDEYVDAVKKVLTGRKDEIMEDAAQQTVWDQAWDETAAEQQSVVCDRLVTDGPETVGKEIAESSGDDEAEQIEMAEYLLAEKC